MSHTTSLSIRVIHPNGETFTSPARAQRIVDSGRGYFRNLAKTILIINSASDDQPNNGYEYGGKKSFDRGAVCKRIDPRNGTPYDAAKEFIDRTQIPVREAGGAKVMQLKPLKDRRTGGQHITRRDRMFRKPNDLGRRDDSPQRVAEMRKASR